MGNWHCVTSDCAKVVYREYKPPSVRWRYSESEPWNTIEGDDYEINQETGKCPDDYIFYLEYQFDSYGQIYSRSDFMFVLRGLIVNITTFTNTNNSRHFVSGTVFTESLPNGASSGKTLSRGWNLIESSVNVVFNKTDGLPDDCGDCVLTIYKDGEVVHTEVSETCPTVEVLQCHLSDEYKEIEIEKIAYLERVEVVDYAYQNFGGGVYQAKIPDECLNVYNNTTATIIPQFEGLPTPTNTTQAAYGYVTQICSVPGCPPPEFEVICDCNDSDCEECPDGTCAVECGDTICCYDARANVVKSIKFEDYYCKSDGRNNAGSISGETGTEVQDFINSFGENYKYPHPTQQG